MRIFFLVLFAITVGAILWIGRAEAAPNRICTTWGADHHVPGYRASDGTWVPARTIPGPCTRWSTQQQVSPDEARIHEHMDRQNRLERERADRERRTRR